MNDQPTASNVYSDEGAARADVQFPSVEATTAQFRPRLDVTWPDEATSKRVARLLGRDED